MIKIETKKIGIPIQIGELEFILDTSDNNLKKYQQSKNETIDKFKNAKDSTTFEELHESLKFGYDTLLGDGAFEKVYEQTPSALECAKYLIALYEGVNEQLSKLTLVSQKEKVDKYLKNKK